MTKSKSIELLAKIGIDMNASQMIVFKAVVSASGGLSKPVTYQEVANALKKLSKKRYTPAYVYRQLNSLEEGGFIIVNEIQHPQRYSISETTLSSAMKMMSQQALSLLLKRRQDLTTKLNLLQTANSEDVAITAYNNLVGISSHNESMIIEGIENVRSTIIREFADGTKSGDCVRVLAPSSTLADGLGPGGMTELRIIQNASKGVKVRGMLIPHQREKLSIDLIANHLKMLSGSFVSAIGTGNVTLKLAREPINTYRMISLNNEKILLYLTHAKESDVAVLVHRGSNAGLIDDAISTFDGLWKDAIDVAEIVMKTLSLEKG